MRIDINASDLVRFTHHIQRTVPARIETALAKSLNEVGDGLVRQTTNQIADQTGLAVHQVSKLISVQRATNKRKEFTITIKQGLLDDQVELRKFPGRRGWQGRSTDEIGEQVLVNVTTMGDEQVCPLCEEIAENGPYSITEGRALIPHHINCRCILEPFSPRRRLPVTFTTLTGTRRGAGSGATSQTLRQLAEAIKRETKTVLRVK